MEPAELAEAAGLAVRHGWKVGAHVWGDHAVRATLDAFEAILADQPGTPPDTLVLEHAGLAHPASGPAPSPWAPTPSFSSTTLVVTSKEASVP